MVCLAFVSKENVVSEVGAYFKLLGHLLGQCPKVVFLQRGVPFL